MISLEIRGKGVVNAEHTFRAGRDPAWADLVVEQGLISRHHFEIRPDGAGYRVWDLGSKNGTWVNGAMVGDSGQALQANDVIQVGTEIEIRVLSMDAPHVEPTTVIGPDRPLLAVELHTDTFVVRYQQGRRNVRDTMPYQLGLAMSMLALYQRDGLGPVPDVDLRAFVWRGEPDQMQHGDINRLLARVRQWFQQRDMDAPTIVRPKRAGSTRLDVPAPCISVLPEGWLYRFLNSP